LTSFYQFTPSTGDWPSFKYLQKSKSILLALPVTTTSYCPVQKKIKTVFMQSHFEQNNISDEEKKSDMNGCPYAKNRDQVEE